MSYLVSCPTCFNEYEYRTAREADAAARKWRGRATEPQPSRITVRATRRYDGLAFVGFALIVRRGGKPIHRIDVGRDVQELERCRRELKTAYGLPR